MEIKPALITESSVRIVINSLRSGTWFFFSYLKKTTILISSSGHFTINQFQIVYPVDFHLKFI